MAKRIRKHISIQGEKKWFTGEWTVPQATDKGKKWPPVVE